MWRNVVAMRRVGRVGQVSSYIVTRDGERRDMGKLNKSVISVDEEGGMSLKTCLSFDEEIEAEVEYAARAGSSNINSNGVIVLAGTTNRYQIMLLVVSPSIQFAHSSPRVISKLRRRASVPNFELRVYHRNPHVDYKRNPLNRNIFLGVTCVLRPPIGATAERPSGPPIFDVLVAVT